jgi:hypothetical protein
MLYGCYDMPNHNCSAVIGGNIMKAIQITFLSALLLVLAHPVDAAGVTSTFDVDADGWIGIPGEGSLSFVSSGGYPDGHVRVTDIGVGGGLLGAGAIAPSKFTGNLMEFNNGTLSVDLAAFAGGGRVWSSFGLVRISSTSDEAYFDFATSPPSIGTWQSYSTILTPANWGKTPAEWTSILSDVKEIAIGTDAFDGPDTVGIDNFSIGSSAPVPVPVPSSILLLFSGISGLGLLGRKYRRHNG